jgi:hypothetical protein
VGSDSKGQCRVPTRFGLGEQRAGVRLFVSGDTAQCEQSEGTLEVHVPKLDVEEAVIVNVR